MDLISCDVGRSGAYVIWKNSKVEKVVPWDFDLDNYDSINAVKVIEGMENYVKHHKLDALVVERPWKGLSITFVLFSDMKRIADKYELFFHGYAAMSVKKVAFGTKTMPRGTVMDKPAVLKGITKLNNKRKFYDGDLKKLNDHCVDAIGIGLCCIRDEDKNK